ncbi:hypothetical protein BKA63DRAFT_489936 [Paraphoma chrysanthemicola]|nr:hypothetical protein BKA63DRAFT_489936 [Paraphoma chrysanthemicola]
MPSSKVYPLRQARPVSHGSSSRVNHGIGPERQAGRIVPGGATSTLASTDGLFFLSLDHIFYPTPSTLPVSIPHVTPSGAPHAGTTPHEAVHNILDLACGNRVSAIAMRGTVHTVYAEIPNLKWLHRRRLRCIKLNARRSGLERTNVSCFNYAQLHHNTMDTGSTAGGVRLAGCSSPSPSPSRVRLRQLVAVIPRAPGTSAASFTLTNELSTQHIGPFWAICV